LICVKFFAAERKGEEKVENGLNKGGLVRKGDKEQRIDFGGWPRQVGLAGRVPGGRRVGLRW
jgi:hypothetical protein